MVMSAKSKFVRNLNSFVIFILAFIWKLFRRSLLKFNEKTILIKNENYIFFLRQKLFCSTSVKMVLDNSAVTMIILLRSQNSCFAKKISNCKHLNNISHFIV